MNFFNRGIPKNSIIVFDMDNTLTDELGATVRPGIRKLLEELANNYKLVLWTNSTKSRAYFILKEHNLRKYFQRFIYREDYDPKEKGKFKNVKSIGAKFIIDDDPNEIDYNQKKGIKGYKISAYRKTMTEKDFSDEITAILKCIQKGK